MNATDSTTTLVSERPPAPDEAATTRCPACVHPEETHDVIATRFCAATTAGALPRGCACQR